ncbi:glycosyltransferase family 2 protein [Komagataeibacter europaeus]|uniref:glycosyltransferase family 2 protein n=1 Tax=Komagataeibacter europaeus TaxID=33995 RepID=UPI000B3E9AA4|nr:glycosyltransferase family 2 protein [Komagataeibacter europaeus]ARW17618.1 Protein RfbJ [Komagataeibacter europaeus]
MSPVAVLIPCYNESATIGDVIKSFKAALPDADIYVFDNNSTDDTVLLARQAGAILRRVTLQGKGYVVSRMFADIEADFYVLVDGDATYEAAAAPLMVTLARENGLDMVTGVRVTDQKAAYRPGHVLGNRMLTRCVTTVFGNQISDLLSGYRVLSRRYVKSFPIISKGFEVETFLSVHALELAMPIGEVTTRYVERPTGSVSKLHTYRDGFRILITIINLAKLERPLLCFFIISAMFFCMALFLGGPVILDYFQTGLVPRFPTAILAAGLIILSALSVTCGLIMDMIATGRREAKRLAYLRFPSFWP